LTRAAERKAMEAAARLAFTYRAGLQDGPVTPTYRPAETAAAFDDTLPEQGTDALAVIEALALDAGPGLHGHSASRFFGYVCGGSMPVGAAAVFLVTAWGQNAALAAVAPG